MPPDLFARKKPNRPAPGDTLGVIAPASPFDRQKFHDGIRFIEKLGFSTYCPEAIFEQQQYLAGPDYLRARTLNEMFANPDIKGIICARGGYGTLRIIPQINFDIIAENPKLFIGFSDITVLLNMLLSICGLVSLHGPTVASFASASSQTKKSFRRIFSADPELIVTPRHPEIVCPGQASGILAGGNLTTLCHLAGTPYEPDFSGMILLLEDTGESPYRIDRMLTQMNVAGCFDGIKGVILGSFKDCGEIALVYRIFKEIFSKKDIPVLAGFDIGHDEPNLSMPFGVAAVLDTENGKLQFQEALFHE